MVSHASITLRGFSQDMNYYMQRFEEMMSVFTYENYQQLWAQTESITQLVNILSEHTDEEVRMMEMKEYGDSKFEKKNPFNKILEKGTPIHSWLSDEDKDKIRDLALKAKGERAEREAASRKERIISGAELHARNEKLEAKQKVIKEVFETSVKELSNCSADDLKGFIKEVILNSNIEGTQNLILNEVGKKAINEAFVAEINTALGNKANIKLSDETGKFKGGFILEQNGIEINNTFEALVSSLKDDLSLEVARVLFS